MEIPFDLKFWMRFGSGWVRWGQVGFNRDQVKLKLGLMRFDLDQDWTRYGLKFDGNRIEAGLKQDAIWLNPGSI
jgi:hypothetical protein